MIRVGSKVKYMNQVVTIEDIEKSGNDTVYIIKIGNQEISVPSSQVTELYNEGSQNDYKTPLYS